MTDAGSEPSRTLVSEEDVEFQSLDGLRLRGTLTRPPVVRGAAVLVHGGGVTRDEGGFYTRLAVGLARGGIAALRFDFRGHGKSGGRQEDLTLGAVANDVRAAAESLGDHGVEVAGTHLIGASFSGGITAMAAGAGVMAGPGRVRSVVLFNPLLDYKRRFVDEKPCWDGDRLGPGGATALGRDGFLPHSPTLKLGRALLNEVFHVRPADYLGRLVPPTLIIHGTGDTFVPVESSRRHLPEVAAAVKHLLEIDGAQHGIAAHDDPGYTDPRTRRWQGEAIEAVARWVGEHN